MQGSCPDSPPFPPASRTGVAVFSSHGASGPSKSSHFPRVPDPVCPTSTLNPCRLDFVSPPDSRRGTAVVAWGFCIKLTASNIQRCTVSPSIPSLRLGRQNRYFWVLESGIWVHLSPSRTPDSPVRNGGFSGRDSSLKTGQADGLLSLEGLVFCSLEIYSQPLNTYPPPIQSGPRTAARGGRRRGRERSGIGPGSGSC